MSIPAGKLNRRITIQKLVGTKDDANQVINEWVKVAKVWAWHKSLNGRTGISGGVVVAINGSSWRIRYNPALTLEEGMRVFYGGVGYIITRPPVYDIEGREHIDLICETGGKYAV